MDLHIEILPANKYYTHQHSTGWVVIVNGIIRFQGNKREATAFKERLEKKLGNNG